MHSYSVTIKNKVYIYRPEDAKPKDCPEGLVDDWLVWYSEADAFEGLPATVRSPLHYMIMGKPIADAIAQNDIKNAIDDFMEEIPSDADFNSMLAEQLGNLFYFWPETLFYYRPETDELTMVKEEDTGPEEFVIRDFIGTVFSLMPSGKYYTPWASSNLELCPMCQGVELDGAQKTCPLCKGMGSYEAFLDETVMEATEVLLQGRHIWIESSEGDPTCLSACRVPNPTQVVKALEDMGLRDKVVRMTRDVSEEA